jgi:hypothetical protein
MPIPDEAKGINLLLQAFPGSKLFDPFKDGVLYVWDDSETGETNGNAD